MGFCSSLAACLRQCQSMDNSMNSQKSPRVFYGWWIVLAGATMMLMMGTFSYYGMGIFLTPILETNGWQAAQIATALSIARLEGGVMAPFMGYLIDRYGPRVLMLVGVIGCGAGYILLSWAGQLARNKLIKSMKCQNRFFLDTALKKMLPRHPRYSEPK